MAEDTDAVKAALRAAKQALIEPWMMYGREGDFDSRAAVANQRHVLRSRGSSRRSSRGSSRGSSGSARKEEAHTKRRAAPSPYAASANASIRATLLRPKPYMTASECRSLAETARQRGARKLAF